MLRQTKSNNKQEKKKKEKIMIFIKNIRRILAEATWELQMQDHQV